MFICISSLAWHIKTCLSKGTGSAFKGREFAQHSLDSSVNLNERRERERERERESERASEGAGEREREREKSERERAKHI